MEQTATDQQSTYSIITFKGLDLSTSYKNLIYAKWKRSLKYGNDYFNLIDNDAYFQAYDKYIASILNHPDTLIKLAVLSDDHDVVLGFSIMRPKKETLDYVHVHRDNRRLGICKELIKQQFKYFTHLTKNWCVIWPKYPNAKFNPFI